MAFTPLFTATQTLGNPSYVTLTDVSTGTDAAITARRAYFAKYDGTFIVPSGVSTEYIGWALADTSLALDMLDKDYSLLITVQWLDVGGNILYDYQLLAGMTRYNEDFDYSTTKVLAANPSLFNDNNFWWNKSLLRTFIDAGNNAITDISDQYSAQVCYDEATNLRVSSQYFFNQNA